MRPVGDVELAKDVRDVILDGFEAQIKFGRDLRVRFTGFLTLPSHIVDDLRLPSFGNETVTLADGSETSMDMHIAHVLWHEDREHDVLVLKSEGGPLVGMELLHGNRVILDVVEDGEVSINVLS